MAEFTPFLCPIAHRGLHDAARGIVENTGGAFAAAIEAGYGIECDLRPAVRGLPVVFHDLTLDRLVDREGQVSDVGERDLEELRYKASGERLVTFAGLLSLVGGRVPLLVEVKSEWEPPDRAFLSEVARLASAYQGPIALMSFDPHVMLVLKELAPEVPRGIVSGSYRDQHGETWWRDRIDDGRAAELAGLVDNEGVEPEFYAYHVKDLPTPVTELMRKVLSRPLLAWTVRSVEDRARAAQFADAPIFEGFRP